MFAELGQLTLIIAFVMTLWMCVAPAHALYSTWHRTSLLLLLSFAFLLTSFALSDFSHALVVFHSASDTPLLYRLTAAWGNHEGSLLLWCLILSLYGSLLVAFFKRERAAGASFARHSLIIHAIFLLLFLSLLLFFSNPFVRLDSPALEGNGLNPLLQHPALALHPPFLYGGYVGLSAAASLALAHLWQPHDAKRLIALMRPLALLAWSFLTIGIFLGAWWAYHELGWGGFWFWDPVENASFIPWCAATALIHALATNNVRQSAWVILLAIISFALAIIGTFLVRSGLITSVHAFASDPHRGVVLLLIFALYCIAAILLYGRGQQALPASVSPPLGSRHFMMLAQSVLLLSLAAAILFGTLYPLFTAHQLSVGPPYYNYSLMVLGLPLALMMGLAPHLGHRHMAWRARHLSLPSLIAAFVLSCVIAAAFISDMTQDLILAAVGVFSATWILLATFSLLLHKKSHWRGALPMLIAHGGIAIVIVAATSASLRQQEAIQFQKIDEEVTLASWRFQLQKVEDIWRDNYLTKQATIYASDESGVARALTPERRLYAESRTVTTESAVVSLWDKDLYVAFSEPLDDSRDARWTTRYWIKPLVVWLWVGGGLMAWGGVLALLRRLPRRKRASS